MSFNNDMDRKRRMIRPDGMTFYWDNIPSMQEIQEHLGFTSLDLVNLTKTGKEDKDMFMWVDDVAALRDPQPPVNPDATRLYHAICKPGTTWPIRGNVYIFPGSDTPKEQDDEDYDHGYS